MKDKFEMELLNWRIFDKAKFEIPKQSFLLTGSNGSGKTSFLAAFYTLWTGASFSGKLIQYLQTDSQYFGITTSLENWFLTGKIGQSGRLQNSYSKPNKSPFGSFLEKSKAHKIQNDNFEPKNKENSQNENEELTKKKLEKEAKTEISKLQVKFLKNYSSGNANIEISSSNSEYENSSHAKNVLKNHSTKIQIPTNSTNSTQNLTEESTQKLTNWNQKSSNSFSNSNNNLDFEGQKFQNWPTVLTYLPSDNNWFELSRGDKLSKLDQLLGQVYGENYQHALTKFNKNLKAKQKFLANCITQNTTGDPFLVHNLAEAVYQSSLTLWQFRQLFWQELNQVLPEFPNWLQSTIHKAEIKYQVNNFSGVRQNVDLLAQINPKTTNWQGLWSKETIVGQVLFGAHRDDFEILVNRTPIQNFFSRGEMRLFILFIKKLAAIIIGRSSPVIGLFDDVFGELDLCREQILLSNLLAQTDYFIATSAQKIPNFENTFQLSDLSK